MQANPKILAIVVNWNKREYLENLLPSLLNHSDIPFDIVLVDNASTDGSPDYVRENFPQVTVLETGENLGGTGGFNFGMKYGLNHEKGYDYLWLLDNDIIIHDGALEGLLDAMSKNPRIGIAGSTILYLDDPERAQEAGVKVDWRTCALRRNAEGPVKSLPKDKIYDADYVAACSLLARVDAVRKVGIWDEAYFLGWDDMDWGVRFRKAGYRVVGTTASFVRHESYNDRRATANPASMYGWYRNQLYFIWRHAPRKKRAHALFHMIRYLLSNADSFESAGRQLHAQAFREAISDFLNLNMGKPPQHLWQKPVEHKKSEKTPRLKRIGILALENFDDVINAHKRLRKDHPNAKVETLALRGESKHYSRANLPNMRLIAMHSAFDRLRTFFQLPRRYDAVVALPHVQPYLALRLVPWLIWIDQDGEYIVEKRSGRKLAMLLPRRAFIIAKAAALTAVALSKKPPPVNYKDFRQ